MLKTFFALTWLLPVLLVCTPSVQCASLVQIPTLNPKIIWLKGLQRPETIAPGNYEIWGQIESKKTSSEKVLSKKELMLTPGCKPLLLTWHRESVDTFIWQPGNHSPQLTLHLVSQRKANPQELEKFDQLKITLQTWSLNPVQPEVTLKATTPVNNNNPNLQQFIFATHIAQELIEKQFLISKKAWVKKDNLYLIRRELGLRFDDKWRYIWDGQHTVLQRRFHQNLQKVSSLAISYAQGCQVEMINLRLKADNKKLLYSSSQLNPNIYSTPSGSKTMKLNLQKIKNNLFKQYDSLFLEEIILFLPERPAQLISKKPLHALTLYALNKPHSNAIYIPLPYSLTRAYSDQIILTVDLKPLKDHLVNRSVFKDLMLILTPSNAALACKCRILKTELIKKMDVQTPLATATLAAKQQIFLPDQKDKRLPYTLSPYYQLPFTNLRETALYLHNNQTIGPILIKTSGSAGYRFFSSNATTLKLQTIFLTPGDKISILPTDPRTKANKKIQLLIKAKDMPTQLLYNGQQLSWPENKRPKPFILPPKGIVLQAKPDFLHKTGKARCSLLLDWRQFKRKKANQAHQSARKTIFPLPETQRVYDLRGISLQSSLPAKDITLNNLGLFLQGHGAQVIKLSTTFPLKIRKNSFLSLSFPSGKHQIKTIFIKIFRKKLPPLLFSYTPEETIYLGNKGLFAPKIVFTIHMQPGPWRLGIKGIILQEAIPYNPEPWPNNLRTSTIFPNLPGIKTATSLKKGQTSSITIARKVINLSKLHISYLLPKRSFIPQQTKLHLTFYSQGRTCSLTLPLTTASGEFILSLPDILPPKWSAEDIVDKLTFTTTDVLPCSVLIPTTSNLGHLTLFLQTIQFHSLAEKLTAYPLCQMGQQYVYLTSQTDKALQDNLKQGFWYKLGTWQVPPGGTLPSIHWQHPLLWLKNVLYAKNVPAEHFWTNKESTPKQRSWTKLRIAGAFVIMAIILLYLKKRLINIALWQKETFFQAMKILLAFCYQLISTLGTRLLPLLFLATLSYLAGKNVNQDIRLSWLLALASLATAWLTISLLHINSIATKTGPVPSPHTGKQDIIWSTYLSIIIQLSIFLFSIYKLGQHTLQPTRLSFGLPLILSCINIYPYWTKKIIQTIAAHKKSIFTILLPGVCYLAATYSSEQTSIFFLLGQLSAAWAIYFFSHHLTELLSVTLKKILSIILILLTVASLILSQILFQEALANQVMIVAYFLFLFTIWQSIITQEDKDTTFTKTTN